MVEYIRLKSRLLREGSLEQIDLSEYQVPLTVDLKAYERDLLNFRRRFASVEDASDVAAQDMVTLSCTSENPRFCKEHITIRAGLGLFSKELENQILGWKVGQTGTVSVKGQPVEVTVEGIRREILPEVDDALAARCELPEIQTAEDIYTYCRGKQFDDVLEGPLDDAFPYVSRSVIEASQFELDPEELAMSREQMLQGFRNHTLFQEVSLEDMPDDVFRENFGIGKDEMLENLQAAGVGSLQAALLGQAILEREGKLITVEEYEAYLRRCMDMGMSEEQARKAHTAAGYAVDEYCDFFMNTLEAYTLRRLKENII